MPSDFSPYKNSTTAKQASVTRSHFLEKKHSASFISKVTFPLKSCKKFYERRKDRRLILVLLKQISNQPKGVLTGLGMREKMLLI